MSEQTFAAAVRACGVRSERVSALSGGGRAMTTGIGRGRLA